jgi:dolichol-phosphate mannosyltransferase
VVDDNSPDGTREKIESIGGEYPVFLICREKKLGLGTAYIAGFKWALKKGYDYVYEVDVDWSHDPNDLLGFIHEIYTANADCVVGSRFYEWRISVVNWSLKRLTLSLCGHRYSRFVLG